MTHAAFCGILRPASASVHASKEALCRAQVLGVVNLAHLLSREQSAQHPCLVLQLKPQSPTCLLTSVAPVAPCACTSQAKKRDHRNLGVQQDLFFFHPLSPGK